MSANSVDSDQYVDGSIDTAHIGNAQVTGAKIASETINHGNLAANSVTGAKIANDSVDSSAYVDGSIDHEHLSTDCVDGDNIQDDVINSEHIAAGAVDLEHMSANSVDSDQYVDGSIDHVHLSTDCVDGDNIADNSIGVEHIKANAVTTSEIADAELTTLASMQSGTASILAGGTALTATLSELNLLDGKSIVTSISGSSTNVQIPTAKAVDDRVTDLVTDVGGFRPIANETSFPATNPDPDDNAGTIVSVKALANAITSNGSGVATIANGAGSGNTVTINGLANSTTYAAGVGLILETTSTLHTYTFHRQALGSSDVSNAQSLVNDFNQRYRIGSSNPTSSLDDGDLFFNTSSNKMLVYNASDTSWDDVQSVGNYFINTISSYSGTGGNSASFNGSAYRFTLSNAGTYAEQHIVSINGVIQKPNSGTSQPAEGFAIDGSSIIFSSAPATGSDYFITTIGAAVNIGTPGNNTVATVALQNAAVNTDKLAADAVDGTKIADDAIDSEHYTDGSIDTPHLADNSVTGAKISNATINSHHYVDGSIDTAHIAADQITGALIADDAVGAEHIEQLDADLSFADNVNAAFGASADLTIDHDGTNSVIANSTGVLVVQGNGSGQSIKINPKSGENSVVCVADGATNLYYDNTLKLETTSTGVSLSDYLFLTGDGKEIRMGAGGDLRLYHDGTNSYIDNNTGELHIRLNAWPSQEKGIVLVPNGTVELYYDHSKKLETTSTGIWVEGALSGESLDLADNKKILLGTGDDLEIYHSGSDSFIKDAGTGRLLLLGSEIDLLKSDGGEYLITAVEDGAVQLFFDGAERLKTASTGVYVRASGSSGFWIDNQENAGKDIEFIANGDKLRFSDGVKASFGTGDDFEIYHDGSHSYIKDVGTGNLRIDAGNIWLEHGAENMIVCTGDAAVELYYDGNKAFNTTDYGVDIISPNASNSTQLRVTGNEGKSAQLLMRSDENDDHSDQWRFVADTDNWFKIQSYADGSYEQCIKMAANGQVELYHNNNKRFETTASGCDLTGKARIHTTGQNPSCEIKQNDNSNYSVLNLQNKYTTSGKNMILFIDDGGNVDGSCVIDGNNTTYNTSSDYRLKENEVLISDGITRLKLLKPYRFNWKNDSSKKVQDGFFAHEVTPAVPEAVRNEKDMDPGEGGINYQGLDHSKMVPLLTAALQEAITKIETLETKVAALEAA